MKEEKTPIVTGGEKEEIKSAFAVNLVLFFLH